MKICAIYNLSYNILGRINIINLIIIKLGGSMITHKNRTGVFIRRKAIKQAADEIYDFVQKNHSTKIIIIHGAGSGGHQLAHKYGLSDGTKNDKDKRYGAIITRLAGQKLNHEVVRILSASGLTATTICATSVVVQLSKSIETMSFDVINQAIENDFIPVIYGDMVFDKTLGMSVCSGDNMAVELANHFNAQKIIYASDVDGLFDSDPHVNNKSKLVNRIKLSDIHKGSIKLSGSHNIDVTGGIANKVVVLTDKYDLKELKSVVICNGLKTGNIKKALSDEQVGTLITM